MPYLSMSLQIAKGLRGMAHLFSYFITGSRYAILAKVSANCRWLL